MRLKHILTNKIIVFLISRYAIYAVQFVTSLIVAGKLGPFYFGIYGFILLILNYFAQLHLGIPNALNVLLVHNKNNKQKSENYIANSLFLYVYFAIAIALLYFAYLHFGFSPIKKFQADTYLPSVCIIAILAYLNGIHTCVLRVHNQINQLAFVTSTNAVLNLVVVFIFSGEALIYALIICLIVSNIITIIISYINKAIPSPYSVTIRKDIQREILNKGVYLFLYNTCFYFIIISIRTIISSNYTVEEFGAFTFSFTIATGVMTLLDSLQTIMFPKMVDLLSSKDNEKIYHTLDIISVSYVSTSHFLVYSAMIFYPLLTIYLLPKYGESLTSLNLISLAILMNANSCGYSTLLIAKNREKKSALISVISLILNIVLGLLAVYVFHVSFSYVIIATLITYTFFSFVIVMTGKRVLGQFNLRSILSQFFPVRLFIPFITALVISLLNLTVFCFIPFVLYVILNTKDIRRIMHYVGVILHNENVSDINQ